MSYTIKPNKFDTLLNNIPKYPEIWTVDDVTTWLGIIGMDTYASNFTKMSVDGLLILELTEEDLENEIQIPVKLHRKKIIKAIELLRQYDSYLRELADEEKHINNTKNNVGDEMIKEEILTRDQHIGGKSPRRSVDKDPLQKQESTNSQFERPKSNRCITVKSIEGPSDMNFKVDCEGIKIGRHSSNQIVIFDESVSRYHAEIIFANDQFYLRDIGSTTGTFIKIIEPLELRLDMIIEVGSYQLQVTHIEIGSSNNDSYVEFTIYEAPEEMIDRNFMLYSNNSIGRKTSNSLSFTDDLHMSNLHCKIYLINDLFFLEDIASTNGSWLRLSPEGLKSEPVPLNHAMVFKIGNSAMYEVDDSIKNESKQIETEEYDGKPEGQKQGNTLCSICWEDERDCVILPCRHNVTCMKCIKGVKACPICRTPIDDLYRIFKC